MNYDIRIKTTAEGQGLQDTAQGFKSIAKEANSAADASKQVVKGTEELSGAANNSTTATSNAEKAQGKWTVSKREALGALKKLKEAVPGLSYVIDALKNPYTAITAAIGYFILAVVKQIEKQKELERQSLELINKIDTVRNNLDNTRGSFEDLTEAVENYRTKLKQLADEQNGIDAELGNKLSEITNKFKLASKTDEAGVKARQAKIEADVTTGKIGREEGRAQIRQLDVGFQQREVIRQRSEKTERFEATKEATQSAWQKAVEAETALPAAIEKAKKLAAVKKKADVTTPFLIDELNKQIAEVEQEYSANESQMAKMGARANQYYFFPASETRLNTLRLRSNELQQQKAGLQRMLGEVQQRPGAADSQYKAAVGEVRRLSDETVSGYSQAGKLEKAAGGLRTEQTFESLLSKMTQSSNEEAERWKKMEEAYVIGQERTKMQMDSMIRVMQKLGFSEQQSKRMIEAEGGR